MSISVTAVGSCRVHDPTAALEERGRVTRNQNGVYGVTHTSKEALQLLRSMAGEVTFPSEVKPFVMDVRHSRASDPEIYRNDLSGTDVLVVELCSVKSVAFREWYFQLLYTRSRLFETVPPAVKEWWEHLQRSGSDVDDRAALLGNDDQPELVSSFVKEGTLTMQSAEEIRSDIEAIGSMYDGPILFVTHFDTPRPESGTSVPGRAELIKAVGEAGAEFGHRVYDPTADIMSYAEEHGGLSSAISNIAHYRRRFIEERVADRIFEEATLAAELPRVG
jgi:hypothetical protein